MARYFRNLKVLEILSLLNSPIPGWFAADYIICCLSNLTARKAMSSICWRWRRMNFIWFPGKTFSAGFQGSGVRHPFIEVSMVNHRYWNVSVSWLRKGGVWKGTGRGTTCKEMNHKTKIDKAIRQWERMEGMKENHRTILVAATNFVYFLWRPCDLGCAGFDMWVFVRGVMYALYVVKYPCRRDQRKIKKTICIVFLEWSDYANRTSYTLILLY